MVGADNKVHSSRESGATHVGALWMIEADLQVGERVVAEGMQNTALPAGTQGRRRISYAQNDHLRKATRDKLPC